MPNAPVLRIAAMIIGRHSLVHTVDDGKLTMSGTQHGPIVRALAHAAVFKGWGRESAEAFRATPNRQMQSAIGAMYKANVFEFIELASLELEDRCG